MKQHRFDPLSFVFGLAFIAIAIACSPFVASGGMAVHAEVLRWIGIGFLLLMGLVLILVPRSSDRPTESR